MKFVKRLTAVNSTVSICASNNCPDVWELDSGDYAVIGEDITKKAKQLLPKNIGLAEKEKIVLVPRSVLQAARPNI